jgi:tetraacyldisaccharide-1-P 4'-kinase
MEICVLDERGFGNGWLLPAGPLREPWPRPADPSVSVWNVGSHPSAHVDMVVLRRQLVPFAVGPKGQRRPLSDWKNRRVHALAAIAKPQMFFDGLRDQGLELGLAQAWPDHDPLLGFNPMAESLSQSALKTQTQKNLLAVLHIQRPLPRNNQMSRAFISEPTPLRKFLKSEEAFGLLKVLKCSLNKFMRGKTFKKNLGDWIVSHRLPKLILPSTPQSGFRGLTVFRDKVETEKAPSNTSP